MIKIRFSMPRISDNLKALLVVLKIYGAIVAGSNFHKTSLGSVVANI